MNEGKSDTLRQVVSSVGNAWIVNNSKSHPGHVYYFNTLTGEAVWNLSDVEIEKAKLKTQIIERQHGVQSSKCPEPLDNPPTQQELLKREHNKQYRFMDKQTNISQQPDINLFQTQQSSNDIVYSEASMNNMSAFDLNVLNNQLNAFNLFATPAIYNSQAAYVPRTQQLFITPTMPVVNQAQASLNIAYNQLSDNEKSPGMRFNCFQERTKRRNTFHKGNNNFKRRGVYRNYKSQPVKTDLRDRLSLRRRLNSNSCQEHSWNDVRSNENSSAASSHVTDAIQDNDKAKENNFEIDLSRKESAVENNSQSSTETSKQINLTKLKCPENFDVKQSEWYMVIDLNILLEEFTILCVILDSDKHCKLVVPENVMTELKDFIASSNNIAARRIFHLLSNFIECGKAYIAEIPGENYGDTITNPILNICFELLEEDYHVILLTKSNELLKYKKFIKINIFTIDEIKSLLEIDFSQYQTKAEDKIMPNFMPQLFNKNGAHFHDTTSNKIALKRKSSTVTQESISDQNISEPQKLLQETSRTFQITTTNDAAIQTDKVTFISNDKTKEVEPIHKDNIEQTHSTNINQISNTSQTLESVHPIKRRKIKLKRSVDNQPPTTRPLQNNNNKPFRWRRRRTLNDKNNSDTCNKDESTNNSEKATNRDYFLERQCNQSQLNSDYDAQKHIINHNNEQIISDNNTNMEKNTKLSSVSDKLDSNDLCEINTPVSEISNSYKLSLDSDKNTTIDRDIHRLDMQTDLEKISDNKINSDPTSNLEYMTESRGSSVICVKIRRENIIIEESSCSAIISNSESNTESELCKDKIRFDEDTYNNATKEIVMYEVENESMEESLKTKCEEWVSRFLQIMEEVLSVILHREALLSKTALPPPWTLHEAAQCIRKYSDNTVVKLTTDKLSSLLFDLSDDAGKLNLNMKPCQYMMMFSYGVSLLKAIKEHMTDCEDIEIAENLLQNLLNDIKNPYCSLSGSDEDPNDISTVLSNDDTNVRDDETIEKMNDNVSTMTVPTKRNYNLRSASSNTKTVPDVISPQSLKKKISKQKFNKFSNINLKSIKRKIINDIKTKEDFCDGILEESSHVSFSSTNNTTHKKPSNEPKVVRKFIACPKLEEKLKNMSVYNELSEYNEEFYSKNAKICDNSDLVNDSNKTDIGISQDVIMSTSKNVNTPNNNELFKIMMKLFLQEVRNTLNDVKMLCDSCYAELSNPKLVLKERCELGNRAEYAQLHIDRLCISLDSMWDQHTNRPGGHIQTALEKAGINIAHIDKHQLRDCGKSIDICKNQAEVFLHSIREIIAGFKSLR